jgi:hypothetical protein
VACPTTPFCGSFISALDGQDFVIDPRVFAADTNPGSGGGLRSEPLLVVSRKIPEQAARSPPGFA